VAGRSQGMSRPPQIEVTVLRVFCREGGGGGNELGVVLDGSAVERNDRQALAARLGYAETVFVEDAAAGRIAIHTPATELPFAGHPTVGTAWLLRREGIEVEALHPPAGRVPVRFAGEEAFVAARPEWCPPFELRQLQDPPAVESHPIAESGLLYVWAWIEEGAGTIRSRSFVPEAGIAEDEATGAAAVRLCAQIARPIEIHQGRGSLLRARPLGDGMVEIGGLVAAA